ncbi:MAG: hypothetical protein U0869_10590 [Chloroflexota bacterium]
MGRRFPRLRMPVIGLIVAMLLSAGVVGSGASVADAAGGCLLMGLPMPGFTDASGTAFIGTVRARHGDIPSEESSYDWNVEQVFDGALAPGTLTSHVPACTGVELEEGVRYLVSAADPAMLDATDTITWQLGREGQVTLVPQHMRRADYPEEVRRVRTVQQALDAMATGGTSPVDHSLRRHPTLLPGAWRPMARAPFAATGAISAWTGAELLVAAGTKAAAWDPVTNTWRTLAKPPAPVPSGVWGTSVWTGSELIAWGSESDPAVGLAYDPATDQWRTLSPAPVEGPILQAIWTGDRAIGVTNTWAVAAYDPVTDTWSPMGTIPTANEGSLETEARQPGRMAWTGSDVYVLGARQEAGPAQIWRFVSTTGEWVQDGQTPYAGGGAAMLWTGDRLLLFGNGVGGSRPLIDLFDPIARAWTERMVECVPATRGAIWTGSSVLGTGAELDLATGRCTRVPRPHDRNRRDAVVAWAGDQLVRWSGGGGEELPAKPDGIRFVPGR